MGNNITHLCAKKIAYYLAQQGFDWIDGGSIVPTVNRGPAGSDLEAEVSSTPLPKILVHCQRASRTAYPGGGWRCFVDLQVVSNADDTTEDDHDTHASAVFELFMDRDAAVNALSLLEGFACFMLIATEQTTSIDGRSWVSSLMLEVECAPVSTTAV